MQSKGGFYITQIKQRSERIFERLLQQNGIELSGGQGRILFVLWQQDGLTMSEISRQTSLAKNTLTVVIDGMVKKGIVLREQNPANRRETLIHLTDRAKSLRERYEAVSEQMISMFYDGFAETEQEECEKYLLRILTTLTRIEEEKE